MKQYETLLKNLNDVYKPDKLNDKKLYYTEMMIMYGFSYKYISDFLKITGYVGNHLKYVERIAFIIKNKIKVVT